MSTTGKPGAPDIEDELIAARRALRNARYVAPKLFLDHPFLFLFFPISFCSWEAILDDSLYVYAVFGMAPDSLE